MDWKLKPSYGIRSNQQGSLAREGRPRRVDRAEYGARTKGMGWEAISINRGPMELPEEDFYSQRN